MNFKYNIKQRTRTIQGLRSFKDVLPKKVKKILLKKGHIYSQILDNWMLVAGKELFKVCYPKSFRGSNRLGTSCLNIMVKRGHEVDVEYSKKTIIDKINSLFGYIVLEKVKLITFEREQKKIKKINGSLLTKNEHINKISTINNDKIKNSLIELSKIFKKK